MRQSDLDKLKKEYERLRMESLKALGDKATKTKPYRKNIDSMAMRLKKIRDILIKEGQL